jgi:uncharacterized protein YjbJ (UPF0337 family)
MMFVSLAARLTQTCHSVSGETGRALNNGQFEREQGDTMSNMDEAKGRIKEAAGDLTDDKDLQREGKVDQASGKAKDKIDDASDKAKELVGRDDGD